MYSILFPLRVKLLIPTVTSRRVPWTIKVNIHKVILSQRRVRVCLHIRSNGTRKTHSSTSCRVLVIAEILCYNKKHGCLYIVRLCFINFLRTHDFVFSPAGIKILNRRNVWKPSTYKFFFTLISLPQQDTATTASFDIFVLHCYKYLTTLVYDIAILEKILWSLYSC